MASHQPGGSQRSATCAACGDPIPALRAAARPEAGDCGATECAVVLAQARRLPPGQVTAWLAQQRARIPARRARHRERRERLTALLARERAQDRSLHATLTATDAVSADCRVVAIPSGRGDEADLEPVRAARYEDLVRGLVAAAFERDAASLDEDTVESARASGLDAQEARFAQRPRLRRRCDALCTCCRGACCSGGGDHAYLRVETMVAHRRAEPDLEPADLIARYLDRIPTRTIPGGCVNQTTTGCSLPRAWRSETCNSFYCGPLRDYLEDADETAPVLAIQRDHGPWDHLETGDSHRVVAVAAIDDDGIRALPLPAPEFGSEDAAE